MANDIFGAELNIDGLIEMANKAQQAMDKTANSAEGAGKRISDVFKSISVQGIDNTLQKLYDLKATYESISKVEVKDVGLKEIATNAKTALDEVNKLIEGLSKAYGAKTPTSTTAQQKAEGDRYNEWLRQKYEEEQIHKQIEDRKTQSTRSAIAEQTQAYAEANAKKQSISRDNDNVKTNAEVARKAYEEQLRMYEKLFEAADKKRPDLVDISGMRSNIDATEKELDKLMDKINKLHKEVEIFKSMESGQTLTTEDYAHIGRVSDELEQLMSQYEELYAKKSQMEESLKNYKSEEEIAEEKRTIDAKIAEYERLVREKIRLEKEAIEQTKATSNESLPDNVRNDAQSTLNETITERTKVNDRLIELENELGDKLNSARQRRHSAELQAEIAHNNQLIKEEERAKRDREQNKQKGVDAFHSESPQQAIEYSKSTQSINDQIKALQYLKQVRDSLNKGSFSSEEEYRKKIQQLNEEIKRQQSEVDKLRGKQENLNKNKKSLMNTTDQLQRKLALLFSVSAIQGYVNKLVQVRGEFELQQRSLEILLQNKKEADRLWDQTIKLAVKSPFTVKQLVTYTKQLAAYRIESDKLYETNKMLADVSAGLGVDMQRLILAFGQVKAANFLRGTELRQFSEAGVNMLDELAKKFTEVEGRTVSVGEVFDRVSKRMVSFKDVEEVFKNITSKGGIFYQMQEKQAETLAGQMANLRDSYDLMLNEIGKDNEGIIKGSIQGLRNLIKEWQLVAPAIAAAVKIYATFLSLKGLTKLISGVKLLHESLVNVATGAKSASTALSKIGGTGGGILMIVSIIISLGVAIYDTLNAADKFQREFNAIDRETLKNEQEAISNFIELANVLKNAREGSEEFNAAMDDLKRIFKDMLPDEMLKIENIRKMEQGYKDAAAAIRLYYSIEASEKKKAAAAKTLDENIEEDYNDFIKHFKDSIEGGIEENVLSQSLADDIRAGYIGALNKTIDSAKNGEIEATEESLTNEFFKNLSNFTGVNEEELKNALRIVSSYYKEQLDDIADDIETYRQKIGDIDIQARPGETREIQKQRLEYEKQAKVLGELGTKYSDLKAKIAAYYEILQKERKGEKVDSPTKANLEKEIADSYRNLQVEVPIKPSFVMKEGATFDFSKLFTDQTAVDDEISRIGTVIYTSFKNQIIPPVNEASDSISILNNNAQALEQTTPSIWDFSSAMGGLEESSTNIEQLDFTKPFDFLSQYIDDADSASTATGQLGEDVDKLLNGFNLDPIQRFTRGVIESVAEASGLSLDLFDNIQMQSGAALTDFHGKVKSAMETVEARYLETKQILENNPINSTVVTYYVQSQGLESVDELKKRMEEDRKLIQSYQQMLKRTGWVDPKTKTTKAKKDKKPKTTTKKTDDPAEALADYLEEIYDRFLDFNEEMSAEAANNKISEIYGKEFEALEEKVKGLDLKLPLFKQGDEKPYLDALDKIKGKARTETKKQIDDDARDATADTFLEKKQEENEATKERIDLLFEEYEIYKEIEKIGMSPAMAKGLFGISITSLDDITQKLQELKNAGKFEGTNMAEAYEEYLQKIKNEETKQQQDRLKTYIEYAKKSVGERAKIELEYLNHMAEIEKATVGRGTEKDSDGHLQSVYDNATAKAIEERNAALQKLEWEEFQKSDMFLMLFEDLDGASEQLMQHTLDQLKNFKEQWADMPLEDVKAITDKINDLESALINLKNPWEAIKTINQNIDSITNGKSRKQVYDEAMFAQTEMKRNNEEIAQLQVIRDLMWNGKEIAKEQRDLILAFSPAWDGTIEALDAIILRKNNMNKGYMQTIGLARELTQQEKDAIKTYNRQEEAYNEINSLAKKLYDASKELVELFVDEDSLVTVFADMGMNMASTVLDTLALQANIAATRVSLQAAQVEAQAFGLAMNSAAGIVGWIVMGIQLLSQVLSAIFNAHDKAKQKEIDKEIENIEKLEKALEDLEERLESVYSMGQLNSAMRQTQTNIDKQIQSYEKMIRLEEEKKKTDKDQIKDWQESIDELREKRLELHKEMVESLGGDYDIRSVARDFVDAWIDAFKETGDGLKGLRENFKEFFLNILLEQAVMKKVGGLFGDAMNYLNDVVLSDYIVTDAERKKTEGMFDAAMIKTNDYLNMLFGENGVLNKYIDDTDSSLSGLQQGVQGVTEETAQIIEAYLNSIRFYIAQDNQNLADLRNFFIGSEADTNPILSQLKMQTELIRAIKDMFSSVIYSGGHSTYGGAFLKVSL